MTERRFLHDLDQVGGDVWRQANDLFRCLSLHDQARQIGTRPQIRAFGQMLDLQCDFVRCHWIPPSRIIAYKAGSENRRQRERHRLGARALITAAIAINRARRGSIDALPELCYSVARSVSKGATL
ncbi:MAG: DUF2726 domain-containing protein [Anaerolineae bacterium]|nr:DUF2726 domain-containing protein [Anaerolineae bacterium]